MSFLTNKTRKKCANCNFIFESRIDFCPKCKSNAVDNLVPVKVSHLKFHPERQEKKCLQDIYKLSNKSTTGGCSLRH